MLFISLEASEGKQKGCIKGFKISFLQCFLEKRLDEPSGVRLNFCFYYIYTLSCLGL